jgi:hypothetical protein
MKSQLIVTTGLCLLILFSLVAPALAQEEPTPVPAEEVADDIVDATVNAAEGTASALDEFLDRLTTAPQNDVVRVLLVIGGVVLLVAGWYVYDFIVVIAGFLIGASVAVSLVTTDSTAIEIGALLVGGLLGAVLGVFLYFMAVFLIGAYIGIVLTDAIGTALGTAAVSSLVLLIGAIIGGMVLLGLSFEFLVVISAVVGAQMLALGLALEPVWIIIFAIVGVIVQIAVMRNANYDFRRRRRHVIPLRRVFR